MDGHAPVSCLRHPDNTHNTLRGKDATACPSILTEANTAVWSALPFFHSQVFPLVVLPNTKGHILDTLLRLSTGLSLACPNPNKLLIPMSHLLKNGYKKKHLHLWRSRCSGDIETALRKEQNVPVLAGCALIWVHKKYQ